MNFSMQKPLICLSESISSEEEESLEVWEIEVHHTFTSSFVNTD